MNGSAFILKQIPETDKKYLLYKCIFLKATNFIHLYINIYDSLAIKRKIYHNFIV